MTPDATPPISNATRISRSETQLHTELDGEFILMHTGTGTFFTLPNTTHAIWRRLESTTTFAELIQGLLEEYDVPESVCRAETEAFVRELVDAGLARLDA